MLPVFYSDQFLRHDTNFGLAPGHHHPESAQRLTAVVSAIQQANWSHQIDWRSPTPVSQRPVLEHIAQVQDHRYIEAVAQLAQSGGGQIDADTIVSPQSYDVALLAVSAWLDGIDAALDSSEPAFVLARPPGHHATARRGMGFCLFSNAAIAAYYALKQTALKQTALKQTDIQRVAILDWDVHHGNGTQDIVQSNPQIAYCSLHQSPCYPGSGAANETGDHQNVLNLPLPPGANRDDYLPLFDQTVIPFLRQFAPDLLIISAGYDATQADPLAGMLLQPSDFGDFTRRCLGVTRRMVLGLEGGYELEALGQSVVATLEAILER